MGAAIYVLPINALHHKFVHYHIGSYGVAVAFLYCLCPIWEFIQEADIQWNMTVHECTYVETKDWIFLAIKAAFQQLRWWPQRHVDISIQWYWYPEITTKIIKTTLSESLEFALKSNLLKVTDPYNVKPLSMTDPHRAIWPIRTTVVTNISGFLWRLWKDYPWDCVNEHVLSEKTYQ